MFIQQFIIVIKQWLFIPFNNYTDITIYIYYTVT